MYAQHIIQHHAKNGILIIRVQKTELCLGEMGA